MPKIETIRLRCTNPQTQRVFYRDVIGMNAMEDGRVGFGGSQASITFLPGSTPYLPRPDDLYWKIALAVPNIELARQQLTARGVSVDMPRQFQDVGYLAHFKDPEGFTVELIEHWFHGQRQPEPIDPERLGGGAHLNLLTLRATDITPIQKNCEAWGMTPLSIQPIEGYDFTLYFFAFTAEQPPSKDLTAIENRTWLYQRPYTIVEVQHLHNAEQVLRVPGTESRYAGVEVLNAPEDFEDFEDFKGADLLEFVRL